MTRQTVSPHLRTCGWCHTVAIFLQSYMFSDLIDTDVSCLLCVSQFPSALDLWSPGADPQPNYVGVGQLDCTPIHLSNSRQKSRAGNLFFLHYKCWVLSASQITQRDSVSVRTRCWALNLTSEEMIFQLWSLHNCQQMMVLKGSLESFSVHIVCNNSLWLISVFKTTQKTTTTKGCSTSCFSRYLKTKAGLTSLRDFIFKYLWLSKEGALVLLWPPPAVLLCSLS